MSFELISITWEWSDWRGTRITPSAEWTGRPLDLGPNVFSPPIETILGGKQVPWTDRSFFIRVECGFETSLGAGGEQKKKSSLHSEAREAIRPREPGGRMTEIRDLLFLLWVKMYFWQENKHLYLWLKSIDVSISLFQLSFFWIFLFFFSKLMQENG